MVSVRRDTRITRDAGETREAGEGTDEPATGEEGESDEELPPTSIEDLTQETDPNRFDRTFLSSAADLTIEGQFDPAAGPKQVLPRLAYTINYNYVYNPKRGRWEPDEGNESGAVLVEDNGTVVLDPAESVNFGTDLDVTDDGDGTVTVDSTAGGGGAAFNPSFPQDLTQSRSVNTIFQNTTGGAIRVSVSVFEASGQALEIKLLLGQTSPPQAPVDNVDLNKKGISAINTVSGIIPDSVFYEVEVTSGNILAGWFEQQLS